MPLPSISIRPIGHIAQVLHLFYFALSLSLFLKDSK